MNYLTPHSLSSSDWTSDISHRRDAILKNLGLLGAHLPEALVQEFARALEVINSYYSNRMEGNPTRIGHVFDAADGHVAAGAQRSGQLEHVAHIHVSEFIRASLRQNPTISCASRLFLKDIHRRFYDAMPKSMHFAVSTTGTRIPVEPGEWRRLPTSVGRFQAPLPHQLEDCMDEFEKAYAPARLAPQNSLAALAAAHHRFLWVHPFSDGNGRVVRLFTEAMAIQLGLEGRHLYSMARGLARRRQDYDQMLARADLPRQGDLDGRGNLSREGLRDFTAFFFEVMEDQIAFMNGLLTLSVLTDKLEHYLAVERSRRALSASEVDVVRWLFRLGTMRRGDIQKVAGVERRQATKIAARLLALGIVQSSSPRGILRLRMNRALSQALLPEFFEP